MTLVQIPLHSLYPCRTMVVRLPVKEKVVGSSPTTGAYGCVTQLVRVAVS